MQSDSSYIADQGLKRHPYSYTVQLLCSHLRTALFENDLRNIFHPGFKRSRKCKQTGTLSYRFSKGTRNGSHPSPSPRMATWSRRPQPTRQSDFGILPRERRARLSRGTRARSDPSPSRRTARWSPLPRTTRQSGSGMLPREQCARI